MHDGGSSGIARSHSAVASLDETVTGTVILPDDDAYAGACALWNGMIEKHPAIIVQCVETADVVAAVNFAREQGFPLSVRGGGHNAAGTALIDDGVVIDLSGMRNIEVDPDARIARAQGGATWADFDRATHPHGLATTGGLISSTGIGGLTLGGGFGWLMRSCGMACDNLIGAEIVTADGSVHEVNENQHADLLWGLRGGGGNFGAVTRLDYRLYPVHTVLGGMIVHPFERAPEALRFYRDFLADVPDELTVFAPLMTTPEGAKVCAFLVCYVGDPDTGRELIKPLTEWGEPLAVDINPLPYPQMQQMLDEGFPFGFHVYWRSEFVQTLNDDVIDGLVDQFNQVTSPLSALVIEQFGGVSRRVPRDSSAFVHRDADFNVAIVSRWDATSSADGHIAWARAVHDVLRPHSIGVYVNYLGDEGQDRVRAAYGPDVYDRLAKVKSAWDPTNMFKGNQNIQPG